MKPRPQLCNLHESVSARLTPGSERSRLLRPLVPRPRSVKPKLLTVLAVRPPSGCEAAEPLLRRLRLITDGMHDIIRFFFFTRFFSIIHSDCMSCSTSFVFSRSGLAFILFLHVAVFLCGSCFLCWLLRGIGLENRWTGYLDSLCFSFRDYLNGRPCFLSF